MPDLVEIEEKLGKIAASGRVVDADVLTIIDATENPDKFFNGGNFDDDILASFFTLVVQQLNDKEVHEHTKTRLLIVLNNCAVYKDTKVRLSIFSAIKYLDLNMETSMKVEGTMAFDSELGRMSEHMLVLLCRVRGYKVKAVEVLEFAEGNVQFAVQLLLAILLKEPPYEFELRVNCMTALLGFTHPSTFFAADEGAIQEKALSDFEDKVNHICKLTKRLAVVRVVSQVICHPHLMQEGPVTPVVHVACMSMMKFITNVYNYATQQATSFRQHVITSTPFVNQVAIPYICKLIQQIATSFAMHDQKISTAAGGFNPLKAPPRPGADVPKEVNQGLVVSLRFLALVTFHMGSYGRNLRFINSFTHDLCRLPIEGFVARNLPIYGALLQFNVNIDSLAGDSIPQGEHLPSECCSESIVNSFKSLLSGLNEKEVAGLQACFNRTQSTMLARDVASCAVADGLLSDAAAGSKPVAAAAAQQSADFRLLGDLPDPTKAPSKADATSVSDDRLVRPKGDADVATMVQAEGGAPAKFRCALNGHVMKHPVRSPHGHTYERDSIENWIQQTGETCPFTAKSLSVTDLKPDDELAREITAWHIRSQANEHEEDDFDVYDF
ncbi:U-box domain-containing protein 43 [Diplonema papillatum]|nr:U-box domain-containing protein 43 [Diplonema papillatum]